MSDTLIILNPAARSERAQRKQARVESLARDCVVCATTYIGEAEAMARRAVEEGFQKIVAAGGDGTINEVVNGLAGTRATLGLLPIGTMNVFATELGLPVHDLQRCWRHRAGREHSRKSIWQKRTKNFSFNSQASGSMRKWSRKPVPS